MWSITELVTSWREWALDESHGQNRLTKFTKIIRQFSSRGMNPTAGRQNRLKPVGGAFRNLIYQVLGSSGGFESAFAQNPITGLIS
jgi:hypothetical protein